MRQTTIAPRGLKALAVGLVAGLMALALVILAISGQSSSVTPASSLASSKAPPGPRATRMANPRYQPAGPLTVWWDNAPQARPTTNLTGREGSNIHPEDYIGADACKECHRENYQAWSNHSHRWMNALADESTVRGDFESRATISYLGGTATFYRGEHEEPSREPRGGSREGGYRMLLERGSTRRLYRVNQTIGSRFFQYYVGQLIEGPEPPESAAYHVDHVLPFGYWLDREEWVPVVHVGTDELPDGQRDDPFAADSSRLTFSPYYQCNSCHTTFPLGDQMSRSFWTIGRHAPLKLHWSMFDYVKESHPGLLQGKQHPADFSDQELAAVFYGMARFEAPDHAVALGVSCEACHLGAREHAEGQWERPSFFPHSPHLAAEASAVETGRTHDNVNWACGRCHTGDRPLYAGHMSTWNSTEYTDAMKGSCYSQLTCIDCHDPHETIGPEWSRTAAEDDASCLRCHQQYEPAEALAAHTHHPAGSEGSRCMNCHMPRINEGLQNVVRTHTIFSPTNREMIEANHPNACGLCHTDRPIDWTLGYLKAWYGKTYSQAQLAANYPQRDAPAVVGWLKSDHEAVRLAATDAVARQKDRSALPALIDVLDDPFLLNRQFARVALEDWLDVRLADFGYTFYMTPRERRPAVARVRRELSAVAEED